MANVFIKQDLVSTGFKTAITGLFHRYLMCMSAITLKSVPQKLWFYEEKWEIAAFQ